MRDAGARAIFTLAATIALATLAGLWYLRFEAAGAGATIVVTDRLTHRVYQCTANASACFLAFPPATYWQFDGSQWRAETKKDAQATESDRDKWLPSDVLEGILKDLASPKQ